MPTPPSSGVHLLPQHRRRPGIAIEETGTIYAIVDNYATHNHPESAQVVGTPSPLDTSTSRQPRHRGSTPSRSFFAKLAPDFDGSVFTSVADLGFAIDRFVTAFQQRSNGILLDRKPKQNHRRCQARAPSVEFVPLAALPDEIRRAVREEVRRYFGDKGGPIESETEYRIASGRR